MTRKTGCLRALYGAAATIAMIVPAVAYAQDTTEQAATEDGGDEEIVVVAQRREERLLDVPLSVTALTADNLETAGVTNSRELVLVTPGLRFDAVGSTVQPTIRGITTTLAGGSEPNVAIYVDGVIQVSTSSSVFELPDVRQIEVLKGPQGTLFGRNATGGAILINTIQPDLNEVDGKITLSYSSFETYKGFGYVSVPIVQDRIALSIAAHHEEMVKGYIHDLTNNGKVEDGSLTTSLVRAKLRFIPWDGADFTLQSTWQRRNDHVILRNSNWHGNNSRALSGLYTGPLADEAFEVATNLDPFTLTKQWNVSLKGDIEIGPGTLTTTTAYVDNSSFLLNDSDNTPQAVALLTNSFDIETFTQELVYATKQLGRFHGVFGVNYFNSEIRGNLASNLTAFVDFNVVKDEAWAAFGEATFDVTDRFSITGGLRYSWEEKKAFKHSQSGSTVPPAVIEPLAPPESWNSLDPRVSLRYEITDDINTYFTFSKGFKSGEFNVSGASRQLTPIKPEKVTSYELGVKGRLNNSLSFNLAAFHYDYKDLQVTAFQTLNNVITSFLTNAASAKIWGAELGADWRVTKEFRLSTGISFLDAEYADFPGASYTTPRREMPGNVCPVPPNATSTAAICTVTSNVAGNTMIRAPRWSGNITASYEKETSAGTFDASAILFASSKVFFDISNRVVQPSYTIVNLNVGWSPPDSGFKVRLWVKNLTDEEVIISLVNTTAYDTVTYMPPRAYGIDLSMKF